MIRLPKFCVGGLALALLLALSMPVVAEETRGTIRTVNGDKHEVVLKGILKDSTYQLNQDAKVVLDGKEGTLADLREGDRAAITYQQQGEHMLASEVRCLRKSMEVKGTVRAVIADQQELILKGYLKDTIYFLEEDAIVWLDDREGTLADLREGDQVFVTFQTRGDRHLASEVRITQK